MSDERVEYIEINGRRIGAGYPVYVVAEMSANHNHRYDDAVRIIHAAKEAGADAVKLQTYTPDTMTIKSEKAAFKLPSANTWGGMTLWELYDKASTPWEWQPKLKEVADELAIDLFSTPFDTTAVTFLEELGMPAYKIASFEVMDLPLLRVVAATGKPMIVSTGMASLHQIDEAVSTIRSAGLNNLILLRCASAYPAPPEALNLRTIPHMAEAFGVPVGFSDHSLGIAASVAAVAFGACLVEKHFTLSRKGEGPDSAFSLEPHELKALVASVRVAEKAIGTVSYGPSEAERGNSVFLRSLFFVEDIAAGALLTAENVRSIRPGIGLAPRYYDEVLGRRAARDIERGTPVDWALVS